MTTKGYEVQSALFIAPLDGNPPISRKWTSRLMLSITPPLGIPKSRKMQASSRRRPLAAIAGATDTTAASETKTEFERQRDSINQEYAEQLQAANEVQNGRTFQSQGFKSQADANAFAQHLRDVAGTIRTAEGNKLELAREGELASGQGRLDVLERE